MAAASSLSVSNVPGAPSIKFVILLVTNSVVANCVVLTVLAAVGAVGVPVSAGEAIGAKYVLSLPSKVSASTFNASTNDLVTLASIAELALATV